MTQVAQLEYDNLKKEQDYAHRKWGDKFDDRNTLNDWVTYITMYASDAARMDRQDDTGHQYAHMLKAAGLCLAAATRIRRGCIAQRHYDADQTLNPKPSGHGEGRAFLVNSEG